jgi:3-methyladenine DNA glycosylase AlkD
MVRAYDSPPTSIHVEDLADEIAARVRVTDGRAPNVRPIIREYSRLIKNVDPDQVLGLVFRLKDEYGLRWIGAELINKNKAALRSLDSTTLERLGQGIDSWGTVDTFSVYLAGPAWRERQVPDSLIKGWARSDSRWWRRAALASTVALNSKARGGSGDASRTVDLCRMLVDDRDDMVVKALSWALRELAKRDPDAAQRFLDEHEDALASRVKREVRNKLITGLKNP